ncbi:TonB-dependent receptor plug domain-containing protein, partial [Kaistella sp.]|uniref:TonB-dependent receptor plug domain-containing protein n=1 Tax=Kaistella sp. TaxID=2782235 RepID=UPI002F95802B
MKKKFYRPAGILSAFLLPAVYFSVHAQTRTVTGIVNDGTQPLSGVTVSQEGSGQTSVTSSTGTFSLVITGEHPVLVFRHPEYSERKITADGKTAYTISLTEKVNTIQEVVLNAGYYNVKAKESTGSIAKVAAKDIENQPVTNVLSAVQGRMSGVSITNNNGNAGGGFDIAIRGKNSLRFDGNSPLIIVNGVPLNTTSNSVLSLSTGALSKGESSPLNAINPNDIESFEVLKDADATAIYGSRGANGVVLITTKNGTSKDLTAALTLNTSFSQANKLIELASTEQYRKLRQDAFRLDGITTYPANAYDLNGKWDTTRQTDWYKTFIGKTFLNQQQELSISGGNALNQTRIGIFNSQRGTVYRNDSDYKRSGFTLNSTLISKDRKLKVVPSVLYTVEHNNLAVADLTRQIFIAPNAPELFQPNGSLNWQNNTFENPLAQVENRYQANTKSFASQLLAEYKILPDWTFRVNGGYTQTLLDEFKTSPSTQYNPVYGATAQYSSIIAGKTAHSNWIAEPQLNWDKSWSVHKVSAMLGSTFEERKNDILSIQGSDFSSNELLYNLSNAKVQKVTADTEVNYRYQALYGRINYTGKDR